MPSPDSILAFFHAHHADLQLTKILSIDRHPDYAANRWVGLHQIVAHSATGSLWEIDIRWTWCLDIQQQQLVDLGWQEQDLLTPATGARHKLICYLCELKIEPTVAQCLAPEFMIGRCWQSVWHSYIVASHPFTIPVITPIDRPYSTCTNLVSSRPPKRASIAPDLWQSPDTPMIQMGGLRTQGLFKTAPADQPLLSIVTVVYNGEKYLEQTIQSVLNQSYEHLEYIIVDGGSTDCTLDIIRAYDAYINYWVSDQDEGIYHAMNKGSRLASGSHVLHLNADDLLFAPDCLAFLQDADPQCSYMNAILKLDLASGVLSKDSIGPAQGRLRDNAFYQTPWFSLSRVSMTHPGFVGLLNENSLFPEQYQIMSDTIMLARKFELEPIQLSKRVLTIFRSGGASANNRQILVEMGAEIKAASGLWQKLLVWLKLQGIFVLGSQSGKK